MNPESIQSLKKAFALQQGGETEAAGQIINNVLEKDPNNIMALNLMGVICIYQSRASEAVNFLQRALKLKADEPSTHTNLGLALKDLKRHTEAKEAFEQSLRLNPRQPDTLNNLGNVLAAADLHEEATRHFKSALALDPGYADCLNNLAVSLNEIGHTKEGLQAIEAAIRINPRRRLFLTTKGKILLGISQYEAAKVILERAVGMDGDIESRVHLSEAFKQIGEDQAAVAQLKTVLETDAGNPEANHNLGVLYEQLGDTRLAASQFRLALKHSPAHTSSYYQLSRLKDQHLTDQEFARVQSLLQKGDLPKVRQSPLHFAMAYELEKRGEYEDCLDHLIKGHDIKARRQPYKTSEALEYNKASMQVFPVARPGPKPIPDGLPIPVFIVGMPRSGTTLTEQIISSHSEITAAGEIGFISDIANLAAQMTGKAYPGSIESLGEQQIQELRTTYLQRLVKQFGHNRYISDKNPLNYNYVGFIATVFPEARIIFCKRNAMDNCASIFRLSFNRMQSYAHSLPALGHYYRQHEKLMDFWKLHYADQILEVRYEDTVEDLEQQARRMLGFIGVEFEEQVLSFFDNKRIVMTPSADQVRQPIYTSSVNAWKKFGAGLQPLIDALGDSPS